MTNTILNLNTVLRRYRRGRVGMCRAKMDYSSHDREHWTERRATTTSKTNDFATDSVFLVREGQSCKGSGLDVGNWHCVKGKALITDKKLHVSQREGCCVGRAVCVFSRPK